MVRAFSANQWLVFVAAMWMPQSMAVNVQAGRVVASHQPTKLAAKQILRVRSCHLTKRYLVTYLVVLAVLMAEPAKTRMSYAPPQKPAEPITKTMRVQPHRRPAAAALPNLAPNRGIKIIARALYFKKKDYCWS